MYPKLKNASCPKGDSGEKTGTFGDWDLDWGIAPQKKWRKELGKRLVHILAEEPEEGRCLLTCHFHEAWKWLSEPCVNRAFSPLKCVLLLFTCVENTTGPGWLNTSRLLSYEHTLLVWCETTIKDNRRSQRFWGVCVCVCVWNYGNDKTHSIS